MFHCVQRNALLLGQNFNKEYVMGKLNGLLAGAIVAGLMAGSIAKAQDPGAGAGDAKQHKGKESCKGENGCGDKKKGKDHKKKEKKAKKAADDAAPKGEGKEGAD